MFIWCEYAVSFYFSLITSVHQKHQLICSIFNFYRQSNMNQKGKRDIGIHDKRRNIINPMSGGTLSSSKTPSRILNGITSSSGGGATSMAEGLPISTMTGRWIGRPGNNIQMPTARDRVVCDLIGCPQGWLFQSPARRADFSQLLSLCWVPTSTSSNFC